MPGASVAVTASALKRRIRVWSRKHVWLLLTCFVFIVGILVASLVLARHDTRQVQLGGSNITLEVAHTEVAKEQGLSGRGAMASGHGMLFVFDSPAKYCFWMKGMRFNLDLIWLDNTYRVVAVDNNLSPDTYPQTFCPDNPAQYIIEVNAGVASAAHLTVGQELNLR